MTGRRKFSVLLTIMAFTALSCTASSSQQAPPPAGSLDSTPPPACPERTGDALAGTVWVLSELPGAFAVAGTADRPITLRFAGERTFGGSDGCNQMSGSYVLDCLSIRMTDISSTMMACDEPAMTRAAAYAKALGFARGYDAAHGQLTLLDESGTLLARFVMQTEVLAGTAWTVTAYNNGKQAVVSVIAGTEITASFGNDGQVSGRAGCNRYFATYRTGDGSLAIGTPGATRMHCGEPAGLMEQEQQYLAALQSAAAFEVDGDVLTLRTAGGETAVTMSKRPQ